MSKTFKTVLTFGVLIVSSLITQQALAQKAKVVNTPYPSVVKPRPLPKVEVIEPQAGKDGPEAENVLSFNLAPRQVVLDKEQKDFLLKHALPILRKNPKKILIIQSLAKSNPKDRYEKTRIALARGLEVREFFMNQGILPKQLKTQPMPVDGQRGEDDRIDLVFTDAPDQ